MITPMLDFDLSKMILVGVLALVVVGPKELPAALRALVASETRWLYARLTH